MEGHDASLIYRQNAIVMHVRDQDWSVIVYLEPNISGCGQELAFLCLNEGLKANRDLYTNRQVSDRNDRV